jgi:hypothetical protein
MDRGLVAFAPPSPLFLRKIFKRQDLGVDLMLQNLENKGPEGLQALGSWKASRTGTNQTGWEAA